MRARYDWTDRRLQGLRDGGANYMGSMFNQPATIPERQLCVRIPNTTLLRYFHARLHDLRRVVGVAKDQWTAQLFGNNSGNSHASTFTSSAQFIKSEVPLRPRMVGVEDRLQVLIWPPRVNWREGDSRGRSRRSLYEGFEVRESLSTGNATREAMATMDHSDIRGLATALHRYVAGLPLSKVGDHHFDAHVELSRIPLIVFARRVSGREWL